MLDLQARKYSEPKCLVHHDIGIGEVATDPEVLADHVGLSRQVAGEKEACPDLVLVEVVQQVNPLDPR